jgi:hypothetical protein
MMLAPFDRQTPSAPSLWPAVMEAANSPSCAGRSASKTRVDALVSRASMCVGRKQDVGRRDNPHLSRLSTPYAGTNKDGDGRNESGHDDAWEPGAAA